MNLLAQNIKSFITNTFGRMKLYLSVVAILIHSSLVVPAQGQRGLSSRNDTIWANISGTPIILFPVSGGSAVWGGISGNISNQTDLQTALGGKQSVITTGTTAQYFRGDLSLSAFPTTTAAFANSTNKNFVTDAQLTVIGNTSGTNSGDNATNTQYSGLASSKQDALNGTGFIKISGTTISYDNSTYLTTASAASTYQPLSTNLTSIGGLANTSGFLKNNGSGTFTYENPAGSGTVTDVSVVSANGVSGTVATSTSTPAITLTLGAITPTTVNGVTITDLLPKTTTSGVSVTPTASGTTTVTHSLGRTPSTIRVYAIGAFVNSTSATPTPFSMGIWNSSGNRCVYMTSAGTSAQASQTSTIFSVFAATSSGNNISGVIQNVTSTSFDIVWTETGTSAAQNFIWEAQ